LVVLPLAGLAATCPGGLAGRGNHLAAAWASSFVLAALGLAIWVLILLCRAGDAGANRFGDPAPRAPG
jgi:uncharacterized membrane protein YhaH (DUF805 family)